MKKIWTLLRTHLRNDFDMRIYSALGVFLAIIIAINYSINLENGIIDKDAGKPIRILSYFLLYSFVWLSTLGLICLFRRETIKKLTPAFWKAALFGICILAISMGFPYEYNIAAKLAGRHYRWTFGVVTNAINLLLVALPLLIGAKFIEKGNTAGENFGVNRNNIDLGPYWVLLAMVFPLVVIASFEKSFISYYPIYFRYAPTPSPADAWLYAGIFELVYGMDFFNVELLFRGFMVIGLSQWLGKDAILPMVAVYCSLHFGKPAGECVSSIFGGYLLGLIAFYTRNIWGGVIVHIGLAWMMEGVAFVVRGFFNT